MSAERGQRRAAARVGADGRVAYLQGRVLSELTPHDSQTKPLPAGQSLFIEVMRITRRLGEEP